MSKSRKLIHKGHLSNRFQFYTQTLFDIAMDKRLINFSTLLTPPYKYQRALRSPTFNQSRCLITSDQCILILEK